MKFHKNNFRINFLILRYIFLILENKILKNPRFFNKNSFQFDKNNFKINFRILEYIFLIIENKILKNPRFFNKNFFQFHKKITLKLIFLF